MAIRKFSPALRGVIRSESPCLAINAALTTRATMKAAVAVFASLWKNRELWWQFTKRQAELRPKDSPQGLP